jgi:hypothetical protein
VSTVTSASRAHSDLAESLRTRPFNMAFLRMLQRYLSFTVEELREEYMEQSDEHQAFATDLLGDIHGMITKGVRDCRTYLVDANLADTLAWHMDHPDETALRAAPPEPSGFVWFAAPLMLPHSMGLLQRVDAITWQRFATVDENRFMICAWSNTGGGRGEDQLTGFMDELSIKKFGRPMVMFSDMGNWRLGTAVHCAEHSTIGQARYETSDADLDALIEHGYELIYTDTPGLNPLLNAVWGLLTGKLAGVDMGGERTTEHHADQPNRAAFKRARRHRDDPRVHRVSIGDRYEGGGSATPQPGSGSPLAVQAYTPGYYRRPRGTGRDHPRTVWVEGFWRGDTSLPVSENSTVYVAQAPRTVR